jgi:phytoene/squalene synthetase
MQLLPYQRREAVHALYAFCREVDDIADSDVPRSLKDVLLSDWRSEIALLYAGCPQHSVTRALSEAVHLCGLECNDFLAIIDGMEMDVCTDLLPKTAFAAAPISGHHRGPQLVVMRSP